MKQEVLIISRIQFGYNTDRYKWCEYLRDKYDITHLSISSREKYHLKGIKQINISARFPRAIRGFLLFVVAIWKILFLKGIVIVAYFPHCEILQELFPKKKMILDIRTMSVLKDIVARERENSAIRNAASKFKRVTAISQGVADQLLINKPVTIIPLGADLIESNEKSYDSLHLLYVGTFYNRCIDKTIRGFSSAMKKLPENVTITYDLVGDGPNGEKEELEALARLLGIDRNVKFHGYVQHSNLVAFYNKCNVGVSYVPVTPYYEHQPVTKTFEYALAGLYVLATNTFCNREVVCQDNGILINDDEESFAEGILEIFKKRFSLDDRIIRKTLTEYSWDNIVEKRLIPVIES